MNHQLQNIEEGEDGERISETLDDSHNEGANAVAVDTPAEAPPVRQTALDIDDEEPPAQTLPVRQSNWCCNESEMYTYLCVTVFVVFLVVVSILWLFGNNPHR